jgi:hypothetical protein
LSAGRGGRIGAAEVKAAGILFFGGGCGRLALINPGAAELGLCEEPN